MQKIFNIPKEIITNNIKDIIDDNENGFIINDINASIIVPLKNKVNPPDIIENDINSSHIGYNLIFEISIRDSFAIILFITL